MDQPDYNLFVLGEVGSGRSSLLKQAMRAVAAGKRVPPDLCYLYNFDAPERPLALRLPAGEGRLLRQLLAQAVKTLQSRNSAAAGRPGLQGRERTHRASLEGRSGHSTTPR